MRVGFIGLGVQGRPLAENLARAGHALRVFDVRPEAVLALVELGAEVGGSAEAVARGSDIILICVLNDQQLRDVVLGSAGVLAGVTPGSIVVVHSTVSIELVRDLSEALALRGVELLDAPVSGGARGAAARTMAYMVGGSAQALETCRPVFEASGSNIVHAGGVGAGIAAKLAHQMVVVGNMLAAHEGYRFGLAAGLSEAVIQETLHNGSAQSGVADRWLNKTLTPAAVNTFRKDMTLCLSSAAALGVPTPGTALAETLLEQIVPVAPTPGPAG
jgi:3-hydroxyisobutyrate dehydrogenase-like beta-hydroxyacid dehydrogenase